MIQKRSNQLPALSRLKTKLSHACDSFSDRRTPVSMD